MIAKNFVDCDMLANVNHRYYTSVNSVAQLTLSKHTGNIAMDINDTSMIGLVQSKGSHLNLRQVDTAKSDTLVDVSHQSIGDYQNGQLALVWRY